MADKKTALILGASGLVGSHTLRLFLNDPAWTDVNTFNRRPLQQRHGKLQEHIVDFDATEQWRAKLQGDLLFSAMGTTLKKAGSEEAQWQVDYDYQYNCAKAAAENGVKHYMLVSSYGADTESRFFYYRMKGQLDRDVVTLGFESVSILRPSALLGNRDETRLAETAGIALIKGLTALPGLRRFRPIHAETVGRAALHLANEARSGTAIFTLDEIHELAEKYTQ